MYNKSGNPLTDRIDLGNPTLPSDIELKCISGMTPKQMI